MHGIMRKADIFRRAGWIAAWAVGGLLGVSGCGSGDRIASATGFAHTQSHKSHQTRDAQPGEQPLADMVTAVSASKAGPPVELKFALPTRPEVGQVMDVDVAVVPVAPVPDTVSVSFQVVEGLDIVEGSQLERVGNLVAGTPVRHVVKLLPKRDGVFALTAVVSFTSANLESSRMFSIPLIAGEGLPDQVAKGR
jgi:hypothetical protein